MYRAPLTLTLLVILLTACSAPQAPPPPDPRVLMRRGEYAAAVQEAERRVAEERSVPNLALLATARAALAAPEGSTESASDALLQAVAASSRGQAMEAFTTEVTGSAAFESIRFFAATRTVMPLTQGWSGGVDDTDSLLGAGALLTLGAYGSEHQAPGQTISPLVRQAVMLLENSTNDLVFSDSAMGAAWVCFRSAGTISGAIASGDEALSRLTAELAIRIAESNQQLAIAVMCDLSSPRNGLRESLRLRHDLDGLGRLSAAMAAAEGCSPGTYAPR